MSDDSNPDHAEFFERVQRFKKELEALEDKHKVELSHEDSHGAFLYVDSEREDGRFIYTYGDEREPRVRET